MNILDNFIIFLCIIGSFIGGLKLSGYYHNRIANEVKLALQKQYLRLQANSDADDPCQPYVATPPLAQMGQPNPLESKPIVQLPKEFNNRLQTNGQATMMMGNSKRK